MKSLRFLGTFKEPPGLRRSHRLLPSPLAADYVTHNARSATGKVTPLLLEQSLNFPFVMVA